MAGFYSGANGTAPPLHWPTIAPQLTDRFAVRQTGILVLLSAISISATVLHNVETRSRSAGRVAAAKTRLAELTAERSDLKAELKAYAGLPTASVIRGRMEAIEHDRRWTSSAGCTDATVATSRRFCAAYKVAFSRLAGASDADELRARITELTHQIRQVSTAHALTTHRAGFVIAADWLGVNVERVSLAAAVVLALALELAGLTA